jgi:NTE family protein
MSKFDVVFEGGGAKGIAFVGAIEVLKKQDHQLGRFIGTSAGAITATLCAAGYTPEEMMTAVLERQPDGTPRFTSFMDIPKAEDFSPQMREASLTMEVFHEIDLPFVPKPMEASMDTRLLDQLVKNRTYSRLFSFVECGGFYSGSAFLGWIEEKLAAKGIKRGETLGSFAKTTGADLSLVVSDTTDMEMLVLNHRTAPSVPVANAVRMSMSIPFVWQEVIWKKEWGTYLGRDKTGHAIVDGGLLSNFPIRLIATLDETIRPIMGDTDPNSAKNLGLLIDEDLPVPGQPATEKTPLPITHLRTIQRISRLLDTMMRASDNQMIRGFHSEICRLPAKGYGTLEFGMTGDRLKHFLDAGRTVMGKHLETVSKTVSAGG